MVSRVERKPDRVDGDNSNVAFKRFGSLGWRILCWMAVVALGPLLVMASQGYHCARQAIVESQEAHLWSVLQSRKNLLESRLGAIESDLKFLASSPCARQECRLQTHGAVSEADGAGCDFLSQVLEGDPAYRSLAVYDSRQNLLVESGERSPPDFSFWDQLSAKLARARSFALVFPEEKPTRMYAAYPLVGPGGEGVGYLLAELDALRLVDPILRDRSGLKKSGKVYFLSASGEYLSGSVSGPRVESPADYLPAELTSDSAGVKEYRDRRGVEVLGASAFIPQLGWRMIVEVDQADAFAWLRTLRIRATITGLITLLLVFLLSVKISSRLSQPLRELAAVSRRIAAGHHTERVGEMAGTEAQEVGRAFNKMLDELAASHRRLVHTASLAAVGELSSRVVHEMRNPLSTIKLNLQALRRRVEGDQLHFELADIACNQVIRLEKMLTDLLGYGKPLDFRPVPVMFRQLARDVMDVVRKEAEEKRVAIRVEDQPVDSLIVVDPEQIRRALTNLVLNAVQAVPIGGNVIIRAEICRDEPGMISISVSDDGPGIVESDKEKLFKPFFSRREGGTGLGLANVKKIAQYHGGSVEVDNRPEGGATFTLRLPREGLGGEPHLYH